MNNNLFIKLGDLINSTDDALGLAERLDVRGSYGYYITQLRFIKELVEDLDNKAIKEI